ncbi:leucine-rich repeat-containing protein 23-like isoform X1 [Mizuhopecten yessoensis]|uniref:leucine-rich repeat-containing protein 23-like isoform X1 n=1 Tax=Mizuhopecten yessoensis TaxID=6573 RepID=UPI000B45CD9E|nr:leucine-rich repeat-containing protein 23-like isoform X1 [Mizuhopecten yessoensis]
MSDQEEGLGMEEEETQEEAGGEETEAGEQEEAENEQDEDLGDEEEKELGEEEEQKEEEEKVPENPLTEEAVAESLSLLCKTGDGLAHAYVRLDVHEKELTNVSILKSFIHLRYVDVSKNNLKDLSALSALTHLLTLKADYNMLSSVKLEEMPFLQVASFNFNKINSLEGVSHPMLENLSLNNNEITEIAGLDEAKLARLHTLELRGNKLKTTGGVHLPNLKNLFMAANTIDKIDDMDSLHNLTTLHLRDNQLENLEGFTDKLQLLQYINLRGNNVTSVKEQVPKMACLPMLRALVLFENPAHEEDEYRLEVLIGLRKLERLDKDEYSEEERNEAEEIYEQRLKEDAEREASGEDQQNED